MEQPFHPDKRFSGRVGVRAPDNVCAVGFSFWKRRHVRAFLAPAEVRFVPRADRIPRGGTAVTWGRRIPGERFPAGTNVWRLEDGFLRSVGLGADLTQPLSWVLDKQGIYYDATSPSDLEHILAQHEFTPSETDRARSLRARITAAGLTKYNTGSGSWRRPSSAQRVILVPGQVETDASIRLGTNRTSTNLELLEKVRQNAPDAFVLYKPHPDVIAGLRRSGRDESAAGTWCDAVIKDCPMHELLEQVDEVHTMTSLTGFEALLRGVKVTTYGSPFYAGWGLTKDTDLNPEARKRRSRRLGLHELIAGSLILYPMYADRRGHRLPGPEQALAELIRWRRTGPRSHFLLRPFLRLFRH
jgi:capsular polysaccharide export protein